MQGQVIHGRLQEHPQNERQVGLEFRTPPGAVTAVGFHCQGNAGYAAPATYEASGDKTLPPKEGVILNEISSKGLFMNVVDTPFGDAAEPALDDATQKYDQKAMRYNWLQRCYPQTKLSKAECLASGVIIVPVAQGQLPLSPQTARKYRPTELTELSISAKRENIGKTTACQNSCNCYIVK